MTDNERLARWQGWTYDIEESLWANPIKSKGWSTLEPLPDYLNNDAASCSLLDTLVAKGYCYAIRHEAGVIGVCIAKDPFITDAWDIYIQSNTTRNVAIMQACLELEAKNETA